MTDPEILEHVHTAIGTIHLERYQNAMSPEWIYEMHINGQLLMSSLSPMSEMQLSARALSLHQFLISAPPRNAWVG